MVMYQNGSLSKHNGRAQSRSSVTYSCYQPDRPSLKTLQIALCTQTWRRPSASGGYQVASTARRYAGLGVYLRVLPASPRETAIRDTSSDGPIVLIAAVNRDWDM